MKDNKYRTLALALSLLFDALGMVTFFIPGVGEFGDIIWAPIAGFLMTRLYKGNVGKAAAIFTFVEEALPMMDVIPTFTIMWFYTYVFKKDTLQDEKEEDFIEVDPS